MTAIPHTNTLTMDTEYQQLTQNLDNLVEVRQKLQVQFNENNQVKDVSWV